MIGGFFKITIFFYASVAGTADLFGFKDQRRLCFPIGLLVLIGSMTIASNLTEHLEEGLKIVTIYLQWPLQIVIPCLLLSFETERKQFQPRNTIFLVCVWCNHKINLGRISSYILRTNENIYSKINKVWISVLAFV